MKAVVLARGLGRRMREDDDRATLGEAQETAAAAGQKTLMPVGTGRPFLDYVLSRLADAGCGDVCLVVAPDHDLVRSHLESAPPVRVRVHYAVQAAPTGTAHAVLAARDFAGDEEFLVLNGDNLYPTDALRALAGLDGPALVGFERQALVEESGFPAARVADFAVLDVDADGWLTAIREKPPADDAALASPRTLVSMNLWRFDARIFSACGDVPRSARGEHELPAAVTLALSRAVRFRVVPARGAVLDLSRRGDVASVSRRLQAEEARP